MMNRLALVAFSFLLSTSALALEIKNYDELSAELRARGVQASVLVRQKGQEVYQQAFGYADISKSVANTFNTRFAIGSATKQITSAAILILRDRGRLRLEDTLDSLLPEYHFGWAKKVTLHHLLTHTSGVVSYTDTPGFFAVASKMGASLTDEDILALFRNKPLNFEPGSKWEYCNSGFFLAGLLIEKYSGKSYGDFLRTEIFEPLGMKHSGYDPFVWPTDGAEPHYINGDNELRAVLDHLPMKWANSAGGVMSTAQDFSTWMTWLHEGNTILSAESKSLLTTSHVDDSRGRRYGYGLSFGALSGNTFVGHGGDMPGFHFMDIYFTESKTQIVVATNQEPSEVRTQIAKVLSGLSLGGSGELADFKTNIVVDHKLLVAYEGEYLQETDNSDETPLTAKVFYDLAKARLYFQLTNQEAFWLVPQSDSVFAIKDIAEITFQNDNQLILKQSGESIIFKKNPHPSKSAQ